MVKTALITGITGQDGFHLTQKLLKMGIKVVGVTSTSNQSRLRHFKSLYPEAHLVVGDFSNFVFMKTILEMAKPDTLFNLAAVSSVAKSFEEPDLTYKVNFMAVKNIIDLLESKKSYQDIRLYQASSSEMFGGTTGHHINEQTPFNPVSPYGESKTLAHLKCMEVREQTGRHISCGILFNHEGEYRQPGFVSTKIIDGGITILNDHSQKLILGNLSAERDWGYAGDFMNAVIEMTNQRKGDDFVIATGTKRSVGEFLETTFKVLGITHLLESNVETSEEFLRKNDISISIGDSSKARKVLGWEPKVSFEEMIEKIVESKLASPPTFNC
jgi:GDPmannose 4,6-dehydratase